MDFVKLSNKSNKKRKSKKKRFPWKFVFRTVRVLLIITLFLGLVYTFYAYLHLRSISLTNTLSDSQAISLTKHKDLEKSIIILKEDEKIRSIYIVLSAADNAGVAVFYIPNTVYVPCPEASENTPILVRNLNYTGDLITNGAGDEFTIWRFEKILALRFDSYIISDYELMGNSSFYFPSYNHIDQNNSFNDLQTFASELIFPQSFVDIGNSKEILKTLDTNLTISELLIKLRSVHSYLKSESSKVKLINLGNEEFTVDAVLETNDIVQKIDYRPFDNKLKEMRNDVLKSEEILEEKARIEVYNASEASGAARTYSRMVTNMGLDLIRYGNAPKIEEETYIFVSDKEKYGDSLEFIEDFFSKDVQVTTERPDFMNTGDIILILGKDISRTIEWE